MPDLRPDWAILAGFAGLALGVILGGVPGPILFSTVGLGPPAAASAGCFAGALAGYLLVSLGLLTARYRQDAELRRAAEAVKAELGLPGTISIKIKNGRATLDGEVERYSERREAERAISTLPGIRQVVNRVRMRRAAERVSTSADDIRERISDHFVRVAELDARIRVEVKGSRNVLEETVHSTIEASEAGDLAWNVAGVVEVENRLNVTA